MTQTVILSLDLEVNGHMYHVEAIDQREYRKWQKNSGRSYSLVEPYKFTAVCADEELARQLQYVSESCHLKPSKKYIIDSIKHEYKKYEDECRQAAFQEEQRKEAERIKEEQRLAHEAWLDEPASITNRQFEMLMQRLDDLERRLGEVEDLAQTAARRTDYYGED